MKSCEFEAYITDYFSNSLSPHEKSKFEAHLQQCEHCKRQLKSLKEIHHLLLKRKRELPPPELLKNYRIELSAQFGIESKFEHLINKMKSLWQSLFVVRTIRYRLAPIIAVLLIGVLIGRYFLHSPQSDTNMVATPNIIVLSLQPTDLKLIQHYLLESEMLLLDIQNSELNENTRGAGLNINRQVAQKLLQQQPFIRARADLLEYKALTHFLIKLEFLLLEVSNADSLEIRDAFQSLLKLHQETGTCNDFWKM
jgi:hypothetical protein